MKEKIFIFNSTDVFKFAIMMTLAVVLFGFIGFICIMLFNWMTLRSYAVDSLDKHGISHQSASRLGGLAILVMFIFLCAVGWLGFLNVGERLEFGTYLGPYGVGWICAFSVFILGLVDDVWNNSISSNHRLWIQFTIFSVLLSVWPDLIPEQTSLMLLDTILSFSILGWILTLIFCVGFVNAVNLADGANGLVSGIMAVAFGLFYTNSGELFFLALFMICTIFLFFNIVSGRLFLGDGGSYGLGALSAISGLYFFSEGVFSIWFLASLFFYPCVDFVVTLARRKLAGTSVLSPDNNHLHNRIHSHFLSWFKYKTLANSSTGLVIVFASSGLVYLAYFYQLWLPQDNGWSYLFLLQLFLYFFVFYLAGKTRGKTQHAG